MMDSTPTDRTVDTLLTPLRIAVSKPAQRAYLRTLLFLTAASLLYALAVLSYAIFYYSYIPKLGLSKPVHLIYGGADSSLTASTIPISPSLAPPPHGTVDFGSALIPDQAYDVFVRLHLPRSPPNLAEGNFMLDLQMLASSPPGLEQGLDSSLSLRRPDDVLARSLRPAILRYTSDAVDYAHTFFWLPALVFGLKREEEALRVPMFEGLVLERVPRAAVLRVRSEGKLMTYGARLDVLARLQGLRWVMYNYRIVSFFVFTLLFWEVEIVAMLVAWVTFSQYLAKGGVGEGRDRSRSRSRQRLGGRSGGGGGDGALKPLSGPRGSGSGGGPAGSPVNGDMSPQGQRTPREPTIKEEDEDLEDKDSVKREEDEVDSTMESTKIEPLEGMSDMSSSGEIIKGSSSSGSRLTSSGSLRRRQEAGQGSGMGNDDDDYFSK